jgi:hypothetical protein
MEIFDFEQMDVLARIEDREIGIGLSKWASADDIEKALVAVRDEPKYSLLHCSSVFTSFRRKSFYRYFCHCT